MAKRAVKRCSDVNTLISKIRRTDSLDWREFNFFKAGGGLSRHDQLSIQVCLDYELGRECPQLPEFNKNTQKELQQAREKRRYLRYVLHISKKRKKPFLHPLVCIATPWFPSSWLSASGEDREKIIKTVAPLYEDKPAASRDWQWLSGFPEISASDNEASKRFEKELERITGHIPRTLAVFDFPMKDQEKERRLIARAAEDGNTSLHVFAINRRQTKSTLIAAFKDWIEQQTDISGKESLRGRVKAVAALRDLGCYRLMTKLDALSRQVAMDEEGFKQSVPKLSEAKRRTQKRLRSMGYI
jgi:hypothetical protein